MAQPILDALPGALNWVGGKELLEVYALMELCSLYIGNDSGLMHLAAAADIPTLGLFGPSAEWRYRPWGPRCAVVRTKESLDELTSAPDYDYRSHRSLMTSLSVDDVVGAAESLWSKVRGDR
jgi:ADP-heptose:LPS heptosyltransferase